MTHNKSLSLVILTISLLTGCGGGGSENKVDATPTPVFTEGEFLTSIPSEVLEEKSEYTLSLNQDSQNLTVIVTGAATINKDGTSLIVSTQDIISAEPEDVTLTITNADNERQVVELQITNTSRNIKITNIQNTEEHVQYAVGFEPSVALTIRYLEQRYYLGIITREELNNTLNEQVEKQRTDYDLLFNEFETLLNSNGNETEIDQNIQTFAEVRNRVYNNLNEIFSSMTTEDIGLPNVELELTEDMSTLFYFQQPFGQFDEESFTYSENYAFMEHIIPTVQQQCTIGE